MKKWTNVFWLMALILMNTSVRAEILDVTITKKLVPVLNALKDGIYNVNFKSTGQKCRDSIIQSETHQNLQAIGLSISKFVVSPVWSGDQMVDGIVVGVYYGNASGPSLNLFCENLKFSEFEALKD